MKTFIKDLIGFFRQHRKFWLIPIVVIMVLIGFLIFIAQSSVVLPIMYTLF